MSGSGFAILILIILLVILLSYISWLIYSRFRARRLGLPAPSLNPFASFTSSRRAYPSSPSPRSSGWLSWLTDKLPWSSRGRNNRGRTAGGAYEGTGLGSAGGAGGGYSRSGAGRGGRFAALDPDEAWDARVGMEADVDYEEQELGLAHVHGGPLDDGGGYRGVGLELGEREVDERYEEEMGRVGVPRGREDAGGGGGGQLDPFADGVERSDISLRGVSPRPIEGRGHRSKGSDGSAEDSPSERRSMFSEGL